MKYLVAAYLMLAVVAFAQADDFKVKSAEDLMAARKECAEAKKITPDLIEKYKAFDYPDEEQTRCYIECVLSKFGLFDPNTGFHKDNLITQMNLSGNDAGKADLETCIDSNDQKSDSCSWAFRGFRCFISKNLALVQSSLKKE